MPRGLTLEQRMAWRATQPDPRSEFERELDRIASIAMEVGPIDDGPTFPELARRVVVLEREVAELREAIAQLGPDPSPPPPAPPAGDRA